MVPVELSVFDQAPRESGRPSMKKDPGRFLIVHRNGTGILAFSVRIRWRTRCNLRSTSYSNKRAYLPDDFESGNLIHRLLHLPFDGRMGHHHYLRNPSGFVSLFLND